jgi:hypothetical protein
MANNAFNFKGIYDKIAGLVKNDAIVASGDYTPTENDYIAVYKDVPNSTQIGDNKITIKEYVSVTDIGTGGGGGGGSMTSFDVSGTGGVAISKNGGTYGEGPFTIENLDDFSISATTVPAGLNWEGQWSNSTTYQLNDVVSNVDGGVYTTWFYINGAASSGNALPTAPATSNLYWAQLGTQGPAGAQGETGLPSSMAVYDFRSYNSSTGGTVTTLINTSGLPGDGTNTTGCVIKINNQSTSNELVIVIGSGYSQGWPNKSQITFINTSVEGSAPVKITGATTPAVVTLNSADGAQYLRTTNSTCSVVRESGDTYWMFGDLTNIA